MNHRPHRRAVSPAAGLAYLPSPTLSWLPLLSSLGDLDVYCANRRIRRLGWSWSPSASSPPHFASEGRGDSRGRTSRSWGRAELDELLGDEAFLLIIDLVAGTDLKGRGDAVSILELQRGVGGGGWQRGAVRGRAVQGRARRAQWRRDIGRDAAGIASCLVRGPESERREAGGGMGGV